MCWGRRVVRSIAALDALSRWAVVGRGSWAALRVAPAMPTFTPPRRTRGRARRARATAEFLYPHLPPPAGTPCNGVGESVKAGGRAVEVVRFWIAEAGRRAITGE